MLKTMGKALATIGLAGVLYFGGCATNKSWSKGSALYNCKDRHAMYKWEGNTKFGKKGPNLWGFIETQAARDHSGDTEKYFAKARLDQNIGLDGLCLSAEHTAGNYFVDHTKAGVVWKGKPFGKKGPFVLGKVYPVRSDGKDDTTLGVVVSQQIIPKRLKASGWFDRDVRAETYAGEITLDCKILENLEFSAGIRSMGSIHKAKKVAPFVGLKYKF